MLKGLLTGGTLVLVGLLLFPRITDAAVLSVFSERDSVDLGQTVRLEAGVDTEGERINTVQAVLLIPEGFSVVEIETGGSIIDLWVIPPALNRETGAVELIGVVRGGYAGRGLIASVILLAEEMGRHNVMVDEQSVVLLHDGAGTSAKTVREPATITVGEAPVLHIRSSTHPEERWSAASRAVIEWEARPDAAYSWTLDIDPVAEPDTVPEDIAQPIAFEGLGDGMHYFHLREGLPEEGGGYTWSRTTHYRILVDRTAPKAYEPVAVDEKRVVVPARDESAGVKVLQYSWASRLLLRGGWKEFSNTQEIRVPQVLRWFGGTLTIRATDGAGNAREHTMTVDGNGVARGVALALIALVIVVLASIFRHKIFRKGQSS